MQDVYRNFGSWSVLLAAVVWSMGVCAAPAALELHWAAPSACPSADAVRNAVLRLVAPRTQFSAPIIASARTTVDEQGLFVLELETIQAGIEGERSFSGQSCGAVTDAAIVTLALSLDPDIEIPKDYGPSPVDAVESHEPSEVTSSASARPVPSSSLRLRQPAEVPSVPIASPPPRVLIQGYVRSVFAWRWGALPESSGELGLGFGLRRARLSTQLSFLLSASTRSAFSQETPSAGGRFRMQAAELTACWALLDGNWRVAPCLGLSFIHVSARGLEVEPLRTGRLYWVAPQLGLTGSYQVSRRVALYTGFGGSITFRPPEAYLNESETIFRPRAFVYQVAGGGEFQIW